MPNLKPAANPNPVNMVQEPKAENIQVTPQKPEVSTNATAQNTNKQSIQEPPKRAGKPLSDGKKTSAFSLKSAFLPKEEVKETFFDNSELPRTVFKIEDVNKYWHEFLETIKEKNNIPAYNVLQTIELNLKPEETIVFTMHSNSGLTEFESLKDQIITTLREKLNNYHFEIETVLRMDSGRKYIMTKKDKFEIMAKENPLLIQLQKDFGLDLSD